jgi:hypothetical protein
LQLHITLSYAANLSFIPKLKSLWFIQVPQSLYSKEIIFVFLLKEIPLVTNINLHVACCAPATYGVIADLNSNINNNNNNNNILSCFVFGMSLVQILAQRFSMLTGVFCYFSPSFQASAEIVP